jgi:hypothetical protein
VLDQLEGRGKNRTDGRDICANTGFAPDAKAREYARFVDDLKIVAAKMKKAARAA